MLRHFESCISRLVKNRFAEKFDFAASKDEKPVLALIQDS